MKKHLYIWAVALLLAVGAASCSKEKTEKPVEPVNVSYAVRLNGGNVLVNLPAADFDVAIPADAASWVGINEAETAGTALVLEVSRNETGAERQATVTVTRSGRSDLLATVAIKQSNVAVRAGEFVIEEIYFTGTALPETGSPDKYQGDQYLKIRNNTDETLYADGMMLILSSALNSGQNAEMVAGGDFRTPERPSTASPAAAATCRWSRASRSSSSITPRTTSKATPTPGTPRRPTSNGTTSRRTTPTRIRTTPRFPIWTNGMPRR